MRRQAFTDGNNLLRKEEGKGEVKGVGDSSFEEVATRFTRTDGAYQYGRNRFSLHSFIHYQLASR